MNAAPTRNHYPLSNPNILNKQCLKYICAHIKQNTEDAHQQERNKQKLKQVILSASQQMYVYRYGRPTLYEIIKILCFIFKHQVPYPAALRALAVVNCLFETCQIPVINMIEVYVLPYVYLCAVNFAENYSNNQTTKLQSTHQKYIYEYQRKCFDDIIVWAYVKPKLLFQTQQMIANSSYFDCMVIITSLALKRYQTQISSMRMQQLIKNLFNNSSQISQKINTLRQRFKQKVKMNYNHLKSQQSKQYSNFFIKQFRKQIVQQFKGENEIQKNTTQIYANIIDSKRFPIQNLPQLSISPIFQTLDPILTFPLNQLIFHILQKQQHDFAIMKQCIRIMTKLIKWGDLQTFLNVIYSQEIEKMGIRLFEVRGFISFEEGQNYLPQIAYQSNRVPFYIEFLRFLQIFAHCKIPQFEQEIKQIKLCKIYKQLRNLKFLFPQNLMILKIKKQFIQNFTSNNERNQILLKRIDQIKVKQSFEMRLSLSLDILASYGNSNMQKNMQIMNSINVLQALRKQFKQMIVNLEIQYQDMKRKMKQFKNIPSNHRRIIQLQNNKRKIGNLKEQIKILQQQLDANEKQNDETVLKYLAGITKKGKLYIKQIIPELMALQKQNNRLLKQHNTLKQINVQAQKGDRLRSVQKISKIHRLRQSLNEKQSCIDELSELLLESVPSIKSSEYKQSSKVVIKNVDNIISITSQYGMFEEHRPLIKQLSLNCIPEASSSSIHCNRFSINSNCISPQIIHRKSDLDGYSCFIPSLCMETNEKKSKIQDNQIFNRKKEQNKQQKDNQIKKNIQYLIGKVNVQNNTETQAKTNKNFKLIADNFKADYLKTSNQIFHPTSQNIANKPKENADPNILGSREKKEPKTPSTFKQCLKIQNLIINQTQFASDYLSARSNSREISRLKSKSKCFSNLPLNCLYSNLQVANHKSKSEKNLIKQSLKKQDDKNDQVENDQQNKINHACSKKKIINIQNCTEVSELYYNNEHNSIPDKRGKDYVPKSLGIHNYNVRARTLQNFRKKHKLSQEN